MEVKRIDITNFGSFKDFTWNNYLGTQSFAKQNIMYGRNYAGKTTLSRLFRLLETKEVHDDYADGKFNISLANGETLTHADVLGNDLRVRVYNSDFRRDNLSLLTDEHGVMKPYAIVGEKNVDIQEKETTLGATLTALEDEIGEETGAGLVAQIALQEEVLANQLEQLDLHIAGEIEHINQTRELFTSSTLENVYDEEQFISELAEAEKLTDETRDMQLDMLTETEKPQIDFQMIDVGALDVLVEEIRELVEREIRPSRGIRELLENELLQQWVAGGKRLHRHDNDRTHCAFCMSEISEARWDELDAHFTEESENYKRALNDMLKRIADEFKRWEQFKFLQKEQLYQAYHESFTALEHVFKSEKAAVLANLKKLHYIVRQRFENVFVPIEVPDDVYANSAVKFVELNVELTALLAQNEVYFEAVEAGKEKVQKQLRLDYLANVAERFDYEAEKVRLDNVREGLTELTDELETLRTRRMALLEELQALESGVNDEQATVLQVNDYLRQNVRYPDLELVYVKPEERDIVPSYQIMREGEPARNLSEGEQSLIAFCYFLATLKDIDNPEEWIIFIDDPLVSLDDTNLYFVFTLIDQEIRRKNYGQFFLATHRLEWLKYFYTIMDEEIDQLTALDTRSFLMEKHKHDGSLIVSMPNL